MPKKALMATIGIANLPCHLFITINKLQWRFASKWTLTLANRVHALVLHILLPQQVRAFPIHSHYTVRASNTRFMVIGLAAAKQNPSHKHLVSDCRHRGSKVKTISMRPTDRTSKAMQGMDRRTTTTTLLINSSMMVWSWLLMTNSDP